MKDTTTGVKNATAIGAVPGPRSIDAERVALVRRTLIEGRGAAEAAELFRVLADPTRVRIVHALSIASLCNSDLASLLGLSESAVSHQMRELRLMKLVTAEKAGRMVYYSLADSHVKHIFEDTLRHVREARHA